MRAETQNKSSTGRDIALFLIIALAYRILVFLVMPRVVDSADAIHYLKVMEQLVEGDFTSVNQRIPIFYPLLCALMNWVVPDLELAARIVSLLASTLVVVPVYLLCRDLHGTFAARIGALTASIWPWLADYGCRIAPEAVASLLWLFAVFALVRCIRQGRAWMLIAPIAFFALHLTRPEGTFIFVSAPIAGAILCMGQDNQKLKRLIPLIGIGASLFVLQLLVTDRVFGDAAISARISDPGATIQFLLERRGLEIVKTFSTILGHVIPVMVGAYLLIFAGVGLFHVSPKRRDMRLEFTVLFFALVQWTLVILGTYPEPRYMMVVVIVITLWSARGVALVTEQACAYGNARRHWSPIRVRLLTALPITGLLLFMAYGTITTVGAEYVGRTPREPREYKTAGLWMKNNLEPGLIMTRKPQVGWYAGMQTSGPAETDGPAEIVERARRSGHRYLVVDERYTTQQIPGLTPLLDPANAPPELKLLNAELSPYPSARIVIYEFVLNRDGP